MSGRAISDLGTRGKSKNSSGLSKRGAHLKAARSAAAALQRIVKGPSPFDLLDGRGAAGRGAALPEAVVAGLGLLPSPWLVRSSGDRAAASAESLRSACAALRESARAADSLHASSSAAPALATSSSGKSGRVSRRRQKQPVGAAACATGDVPPPSTVTAAAAQVTAAAVSSAKRSRAASQRDAPAASHRATPTRTAATGSTGSAPATAAAVAARAASRARRVERTEPAARLALSLVIMGAVLFAGLAARARFAAIDSPTLRVDTGLRLPSAADAASPENMELDGGALQFRAGGARAVAAAAAEAEARRLSAATGAVHEAVSVVTDGTESQSGIQSLLPAPASVSDLPDWQRTAHAWLDESVSCSRCSCIYCRFRRGRERGCARCSAVDAAMHGRCLLGVLLACWVAQGGCRAVPLAVGDGRPRGTPLAAKVGLRICGPRG